MVAARRHYTDTKMPPFGVAESLVDMSRITDLPPTLAASFTPSDLFRFWLLSHDATLGALFWRTAVLRECLPSPDSTLDFVALGEPLR